MAQMHKRVETLGSFEQLVLAAVLASGDDAYGMAVYEKVVEIGRKPVKLGAIYVTLDRLDEKGLLSSWKTDPLPERGWRSKRCYRLEPSGMRALQEAALVAKSVVETIEDCWGQLKWNRART